MKKRTAVFLMLSLLMLTLLPAAATADEAIPEPAAEAAAPEAAVPEDNLVTTQHTAVIQGEEIAYTATTGTMAVKTGEAVCEFFFRAYTRDGFENLSERPITFAFNGGPEAAAYTWSLAASAPNGRR